MLLSGWFTLSRMEIGTVRQHSSMAGLWKTIFDEPATSISHARQRRQRLPRPALSSRKSAQMEPCLKSSRRFPRNWWYSVLRGRMQLETYFSAATPFVLSTTCRAQCWSGDRLPGRAATCDPFSTALDMAHTLGAPLVGANYWGLAAQTGVGFAGIGFAAGYIDWDKVRTEEKLWLDTHVSAMRDKFPDVKLSTVSASSSPARGLQALSSKALIVAVGSRGRGTLRGAALGSVSQNLLHHAESAVLIVR
jgi:nucleotide-binding universal stress UspA family protein